MEKQISPDQLKRLQVLYGQLAARTIGMDHSREARIRWAIERLHKRVSSFKDLTAGDAGFLIDSIQEELGVKVPPRKHKRMGRDAAHRAGTEGRRNDASNETTLASQADLDRIKNALVTLDWNQTQFEEWLSSSRSPLRHKSPPQIRTLGDANRVWWALKGMIRQCGLWKERK